MSTALTDLLAKHQAIIDAWYAEWLRQQEDRAKKLFAKKGMHPPGARITSEAPER